MQQTKRMPRLVTRAFAVWVMDALLVGVGAAVLYWLLWGASVDYLVAYGACGGAMLSGYWRWRRVVTPGERLVSRRRRNAA